jgi:serine/threonine protein kinase
MIQEEFKKMPDYFMDYVSGTKQYMAPELFVSPAGVQGDLSKVDTFAIGVLLINLLSARYAFESWKDPLFHKFLTDPAAMVQQLSRGDDTGVPEEQVALGSLLSGMLSPDRTTRLSLEQVIEHAWLNDFVQSS